MFKKPRTNADSNLKKIIWDRYIGPGIKETTCPLCSTYKIENNVNSGFVAAHLVASKFVIEEKLNIFHVFPSCSSCNSECGDLTVFDYLFCRQRINALKRLVKSVYKVFIEENGNILTNEHRLIWKVLDHLYGNTRYPAGGGIINTKPIYEIARGEQLVLLADTLTEKTQELVKLSNEYQLVASSEIKPFML
jgi:hypothetical protein